MIGEVPPPMSPLMLVAVFCALIGVTVLCVWGLYRWTTLRERLSPAMRWAAGFAFGGVGLALAAWLIVGRAGDFLVIGLLVPIGYFHAAGYPRRLWARYGLWLIGLLLAVLLVRYWLLFATTAMDERFRYGLGAVMALLLAGWAYGALKKLRSPPGDAAPTPETETPA